MEKDQLKLALDLALSARTVELDCDECLGRVAAYAEAVQSGRADEDTWRDIRFHMEVCVCCRTEFEALLLALGDFSSEPG